MCQYTTTNLSSTECDLYRTGRAAHQYTKWIYWLCRDSRDGRPCSHEAPKEDQVENDLGWRHGLCPVCENSRLADEKYKLAVQRATDVYSALVKKAYDTNLLELDEAKYVVESVPYTHRTKGHHHRHHY